MPFTVTTLSHLTALIGGELDMGTKVSGASYLCANSGLPIIDIGSSFGASGAAGLVNHHLRAVAAHGGKRCQLFKSPCDNQPERKGATPQHSAKRKGRAEHRGEALGLRCNN